MSRCDYKIISITNPGYTQDTSKVIFRVYEGDVGAADETVVAANGISSTQSVTRYRRTSVLAASVQLHIAHNSIVSTLNTYLRDNYVTGSRTAIDEQQA